jgi:hypothetical protein
MFKRRGAERRGPTQQEGARAEKCPKCGSTEVLGDYCQRCRVKVSEYQAYLATLGRGAQRALAKKRSWFVFASQAAPPEGWRSSYEDGLVRKIYRELSYPAAARGVYLVLLAFHLNAAGQPVGLELTVEPRNPDVSHSVRMAVTLAQPFPLPPGGNRRSREQRITLALTVSIDAGSRAVR